MGEREAVLSLYRSLLRESMKFTQYSYKSYTYTRTRDYFREFQGLADKAEIQKAMKFGKDNLEILKRQVLINSLYSSEKLIIEKQKRPVKQ